MRTTITFADDVAAVVEQRRVADGVGVSETVNNLIRAGLIAGHKRSVPPPLPTFDLGLRIDVRNVAEALEHLEGPGA